jgi:hypothetical protein
MLSELGLFFASCYDFFESNIRHLLSVGMTYEMRFDLMRIMVASWYAILIINAPALMIIALALLDVRYVP